jgi:hypothetical protein
MKRSGRGFSVAVVGAMVLLSGCGAPQGPEEEREPGAFADDKGDVLDPTADVGFLDLVAPPAASPSGATPVFLKVSYRGATLGTGLHRLVPGSGSLETVTNAQGVGIRRSQDLVIRPAMTSQVRLGGLEVPLELLALDFGPVPLLVADEGIYVAPAERYIPMLPGQFAGRVAVFQSRRDLTPLASTLFEDVVVDVEVPPGAVSAPPGLPDRSATLKIEQPERAYPDVDCPVQPRLVFQQERNREWRLLQATNIDGSQTSQYRVLPLGPEDAAYRYAVKADRFSFAPPLAAGQTTTVRMRRLDVNHVAVTLDDGTSALVPGTWKIAGEDNVALSCPEFPTQTGIDLPPGVYVVYVFYATATGPATLRYDLDWR